MDILGPAAVLEIARPFACGLRFLIRMLNEDNDDSPSLPSSLASASQDDDDISLPSVTGDDSPRRRNPLNQSCQVTWT